MKKIFILTFFVFNIFLSSNLLAQISSNQPNIKTQVNIQKDDKGNVISYDSTYVETWSSDGSDVDIDAIMRSLDKDFGGLYLNKPNDLFFDNDTDAQYDNDLFFFPDIDDIQKDMMKQMQEMQKYFEDFFMSYPEDNNIKEEKLDYNSIKI